MTKLCEICGASFELKFGRGSGNRITCYNCTDKPESRSPHYRNKHLKSKYGITYHQYMKMYEEQAGQCKICDNEITFLGTDLKVTHKREATDPCVDHCHSTGKVRGLLCFHCNTALGHVFDDVKILDRMKQYLSN